MTSCRKDFLLMNIWTLLLALASIIPTNASSLEPFQLNKRATTVTTNPNYNSSSHSNYSTNPCASVSAIVSTQTRNGDNNTEVPSQLAYDCLQSVPLSKAKAYRLVQSFRAMFEFQSTTAFNKNPPDSYKMPAIDASATFDQIEQNITSGAYHGEYDMQLAIYRLVIAIHDDHLDYTPDLIGDAFKFVRPISLISFSEDGTSLPKLYVVEDLSKIPGNPSNASAVIAINGEPASSFVEDLSQFESGQDPDANYNRVLMNLPASSLGNNTGSFSQSKLFPGASTKLQFENGSTLVLENKATVHADFSKIDSPEALYAQVCSEKPLDEQSDNQSDNQSSKGKKPQASTTKGQFSKSNVTFLIGQQNNDKENDESDNGNNGNGNNDSNNSDNENSENDEKHSEKAATRPPLTGYPSPFVRDSQNIISGYHLTGNHSNTAVLAISGFGRGAIFQSIVTAFLTRSLQANMAYLIIDLQSNGGGDEDPEYDLFGQLFPYNKLYEASAWRAFPLFKTITQTMDELRRSSSADLTVKDRNLVSTTTPDHESFNFRDEITVNFSNFNSFGQWYGPFQSNNDEFTSASQANLSTPASGKRQQGINEITGYGRKVNANMTVFKPQKIVVLTNGDCSSMCASFIEQTRTISGLKFVAVGGRPQFGEMAIVGGTRGGGFISLKDLASTISTLRSLVASIFPSKLEAFKTSLRTWDTYALTRSSGHSKVNTRNTLRGNDATGIPTQFMFDPADCRMFYTRADMMSMQNLWERVADTVFRPGSGRVCSRTGKT